jgi:hypothetical protein
MQTKAAYDAIRRVLEADAQKRIVRSSFDEEVFGNFVISFIARGEPMSIVNDRGQLFLYDGINANEFRRTLLNDLYSADEAGVVSAVDI